MVRGAEYNLTLSPKNRVTGQIITNTDLVNNIELVLCHSGSTLGVKKYSLNNGIVAIGDGRYKITIPAADTLLLPTRGRAFLEGFILPIKKSVKIDLGSLSDNKSNYELPNA